MRKYTIGALFKPDFSEVLLIEKVKPEWQKGKLNFPGGSIEAGESGAECVAREFDEECGIKTTPSYWEYIGQINGTGYVAFFYTAIYDDRLGVPESMTSEKVKWVSVNNLPDNLICNLRWLIPFAVNTHVQGNADTLVSGQFNYED